MSNIRHIATEGSFEIYRAGHVLIVNHFSGQAGWRMLERVAKSFADRVGFRSEFDFEAHVPHPDWTVLRVEAANPFSLSRLVVIRNGD